MCRNNSGDSYKMFICCQSSYPGWFCWFCWFKSLAEVSFCASDFHLFWHHWNTCTDRVTVLGQQLRFWAQKVKLVSWISWGVSWHRRLSTISQEEGLCNFSFSKWDHMAGVRAAQASLATQCVTRHFSHFLYS